MAKLKDAKKLIKETEQQQQNVAKQMAPGTPLHDYLKKKKDSSSGGSIPSVLNRQAETLG